MKKNFIFILILLSTTLTFGQKIELDGLTVKIKEYEIVEQEDPMSGKSNLIRGSFVVKKGKKKVAIHSYAVTFFDEYLISLMKNDTTINDSVLPKIGEINRIAFFDSKGLVNPSLKYDSNEQAFSYYYEGKIDGRKEIAINNKSQQEIVLSGLYIWARLTYEK
jgi:hypothetical protein